MVDYLTVKNLIFVSGLSILLNLFLSFALYFVSSNYKSYKLSIRQSVRDFLNGNARDVLLDLFDIVEHVVHNSEDSSIRKRFRTLSGDVMKTIDKWHDISKNAPELAERMFDLLEKTKFDEKYFADYYPEVKIDVRNFLRQNYAIFKQVEGSRAEEISFLLIHDYWKSYKFVRKTLNQMGEEIAKKLKSHIIWSYPRGDIK